MPHAVVTGATSGIGQASVAALLAAGWDVTAWGRRWPQDGSPGQASVPEPRLQCVSVDLTQPLAIAQALDTLTATRPKVDLLFNCAGVQPWHLTRTADGLETGLATNVLAPIQLMAGLSGHLAREPAALVLNMGSVVHRWAQITPGDLNFTDQAFEPNAAYYRSKLALMLVSQAFSRRLAACGATVWALEPGMTRTFFARDFQGFYRVMSVLWRPFMRQPASVAAEVVALAEQRPPEPGPHRYWSHGKIADLSALARDEELQEAVLAACIKLMPPAARPWTTADQRRGAPDPLN